MHRALQQDGRTLNQIRGFLADRIFPEVKCNGKNVAGLECMENSSILASTRRGRRPWTSRGIYMDRMSAIVNFVPRCWFLSAMLCTVAAKLPDLGRWPRRLCSSDMISAANSTKTRHHEMDVDAQLLFSFPLVSLVWGRSTFQSP